MNTKTVEVDCAKLVSAALAVNDRLRQRCVEIDKALKTARPLRINGRLAWPVAELCRILGGFVMSPELLRMELDRAEEAELQSEEQLRQLAWPTAGAKRLLGVTP